jgi:hypothetical protein
MESKPIKEKKLTSRANLQERLSDEEREQKEKEISDQLDSKIDFIFYFIFFSFLFFSFL